MRVSRRKDDDCFVADPREIKVFLDGAPQRDVVFADDEAGIVIALARGVDRFVEETRRGSVRIEVPSKRLTRSKAR